VSRFSTPPGGFRGGLNLVVLAHCALLIPLFFPFLCRCAIQVLTARRECGRLRFHAVSFLTFILSVGAALCLRPLPFAAHQFCFFHRHPGPPGRRVFPLLGPRKKPYIRPAPNSRPTELPSSQVRRELQALSACPFFTPQRCLLWLHSKEESFFGTLYLPSSFTSFLPDSNDP